MFVVVFSPPGSQEDPAWEWWTSNCPCSRWQAHPQEVISCRPSLGWDNRYSAPGHGEWGHQVTLTSILYPLPAGTRGPGTSCLAWPPPSLPATTEGAAPLPPTRRGWRPGRGSRCPGLTSTSGASPPTPQTRTSSICVKSKILKLWSQCRTFSLGLVPLFLQKPYWTRQLTGARDTDLWTSSLPPVLWPQSTSCRVREYRRRWQGRPSRTPPTSTLRTSHTTWRRATSSPCFLPTAR